MNNGWSTTIGLLKDIFDHSWWVEEVPVKWMDRPSATEMEIGRASEMDRQTKGPKNENASEIENIY